MQGDKGFVEPGSYSVAPCVTNCYILYETWWISIAADTGQE